MGLNSGARHTIQELPGEGLRPPSQQGIGRRNRTRDFLEHVAPEPGEKGYFHLEMATPLSGVKEEPEPIYRIETDYSRLVVAKGKERGRQWVGLGVQC